MQHHYQTGAGGLQSRPWTHDEAPWEVEEDEALRTVYEANAPLILENHSESSVTSTYNVPLTNDFTVPQLMEQAERLYDRQGHAFRLNLEFGLILRHTELETTVTSGHFRTSHSFKDPSIFHAVKTSTD
ncbi:Hypothetical predicted protein [Mytilus galloprovincialis]|uniref:Uncharacterized protein n=2 Tax=Mytilus galloprovincialis TaxID=29158 RepID=A0A8B6GLY6_MYTGA|nr:Hypothetical predicted protein [Mytilus galloprovincialis]